MGLIPARPSKARLMAWAKFKDFLERIPGIFELIMILVVDWKGGNAYLQIERRLLIDDSG